MFPELVLWHQKKEANMASNNRIRSIMVQVQPHLDTLCAVWLLQNTKAGQQKYPGIENAKIEYWGHGTVSPDGKTWRDFMKEGRLPVGILGGQLDEHPSPEFGDRKLEGESTTSLVAKDLGLEKNPRFKSLIKAVTKSDLEGAGDDRALHLATIIKHLHRGGFDAIGIAFTAIQAIVDSQQRFLDAVQDIRNRVNAEWRELKNGLVVIGINSDNDQIGPAARWLKDSNIAVVVQRRESGNILILTNSKLVGDETADKIAVDIRSAELVANGRAKEASNLRSTLAKPGQMSLLTNWCYQVPGNNMLNGTETAPDVPATKIDPIEILDIVCRHVQKQAPIAIENRAEALPA